ncbi:Tyrosine-protein phosphatase non-receptor type 1 [Dictyocoela muelleri]|nr:Tyrosine-protein phosphatase non-receptor type 1 [Dictyocoela muelleri]
MPFHKNEIDSNKEKRIKEFMELLSDINYSNPYSNINPLIYKLNILQKKHLTSIPPNDYDRYPNLIPYDNEVIVKYNIKNYVNASIIKTDNINFIAASYPKLKYKDRFLELIEKTNSKIIISLHVDDDDFLKDCKIIGEEANNNIYEIKIYKIGNLVVKRFIMKTWADFDIPNSADLEKFYKIFISNFLDEEKSNVIIHCLAGVGRTGTFILYHILKQKKNVTVKDVFENFIYLRSLRPCLVFNQSQLAFILDNFIYD